MGVLQVVAPLAARWNIENVVAYHINIDVNRVAEQLAVRYVFGYEDDASIVLFTLNESRDFLASNQILDFLLNDMCSSPIVIQNVDVGHQKQLVALRGRIFLPRLGHLLKAAHTLDFDEDAFFGAEEVELAATILVVPDKFHTQTLVLDDVPNVVFAQLLQIDTISKTRAALNHTLINHFLERLVLARQTNVIQELAPEAAVNQMAGGVFGAANIKVHVLPIVVGFATEIFLVVVRVFVAEIVTARTGKARHSVGLDGIAFFRDPILGAGQRRLARFGGLVFINGRQLQWQFRLVHSVWHPVLVVNRERLAPITLAAEDGIAKAVIGLARADAQFPQFLNHTLDGVLHGQAIKEARIDQFAVLGIKTFLPSGGVGRLGAGFLHHLDDRQVEMTRKGEVAAVVGRHGHNGTRTVTHQNIVGNPNRQFGSRDGIDAVSTRESTTHLSHLGHTLTLAAILGAGNVFFHGDALFRRSDL